MSLPSDANSKVLSEVKIHSNEGKRNYFNKARKVFRSQHIVYSMHTKNEVGQPAYMQRRTLLPFLRRSSQKSQFVVQKNLLAVAINFFLFFLRYTL